MRGKRKRRAEHPVEDVCFPEDDWRESLPSVVEKSLSVVTDGIFATGTQAAVYVDGECLVNLALGVASDGYPMQPDHLYHVGCSFNLITYLVLGRVLEDAGFGPDDPFDAITSMPEWCPDGVTLRSLMDHSAGLGIPSAWRIATTDPSDVPALMSTIASDRDPAYSEITAPLISDHMISSLTGCDSDTFLLEQLIRPHGLADDVIVKKNAFMPGGARLRLPVVGLPYHPMPMLGILHDRGPTTDGRVVTMRGMAALYSLSGDVMLGTPVDGLLSPELFADLIAPEHLEYEVTDKRYRIWAGGFIHDLADAKIALKAGAGSIGHSGAIASQSALFDPTRRAAVAFYGNGASMNFEEMDLERSAPVDRILTAIPTVEERAAA